MAKAERLVLVDGSWLVYRAFFAIPANLQTKAGLPTNAIFVFAMPLLPVSVSMMSSANWCTLLRASARAVSAGAGRAYHCRMKIASRCILSFVLSLPAGAVLSADEAWPLAGQQGLVRFVIVPVVQASFRVVSEFGASARGEDASDNRGR